METCTQCIHRVEQGIEPACVHHCMGKARLYGDLDDPNSEIAKHLAANQDRAFQAVGEPGDQATRDLSGADDGRLGCEAPGVEPWKSNGC